MSHALVFRTIREQTADRIRTDVITGRLAEGTNLREQALAKQYGVSRAPIRDALLQLTQEGLLVAKPNCGVRVGSPSGEEIQPREKAEDRRLKAEGGENASTFSLPPSAFRLQSSAIFKKDEQPC